MWPMGLLFIYMLRLMRILYQTQLRVLRDLGYKYLCSILKIM